LLPCTHPLTWLSAEIALAACWDRAGIAAIKHAYSLTIPPFAVASDDQLSSPYTDF
jgi:hypothetical protein